MKWITASDIDCWTDKESRRAQEIIPLLICKLILATCRYVKDVYFQFGNTIQYSGYDGKLDTEDTSPFFPTGMSVWEIGTDKEIQSKFNDDYAKRTKDSQGVDKSNTTFCFVSSRIWKHKGSML